MALPSNLISEFVKITKDNTPKKTETIVYGTIVKSDESTYMKIDGSELLTPVILTTNVVDGERVTGMIKNHSLVVTGNITSPSARTAEVEGVNEALKELDILIADKISVNELNANVINAVTGKFQEIVSGKLTTDELYAAFAEIMTLKVGSLNANNITADKLAAALASFVVVTAGTANFDKATVQHLVANLFNLTGSGVMEDVFIHNLKIAYAQMVSASIGNLVLQSSSGEYYQIDVDQEGNVSATKVEPSPDEIENGVYGETRPILATSMTVDDMNASDIKAVHMLINKIDAARIDVDQLFANTTFTNLLATSNIIGGKSLTIIAGESELAQEAAKNASKIFRQETQPDVESGIKNGDIWIKPSTGAMYQADTLNFSIDEDGVIYLEHEAGDGYSARISPNDPYTLETNFKMVVNSDSIVTAMPATWNRVLDNETLSLIENLNDTVDGKTTVFYQPDDPVTTGGDVQKGDLWYDTDTNPVAIKRRVGTEWIDITDEALSQALAAAKDAADIADKKIVSYAQTGKPGENDGIIPNEGDLWIDTDDGNKLYRYDKVNGWLPYQDAAIAESRAYAKSLADGLKDEVDGKTTVFYQNEEPTEGMSVGDMWYDTNADPVEVRRYDGNSWGDPITDTIFSKALGLAGTAIAIADGKIVSYASDTEPSNPSDGDIWINTADGNKLYRYDKNGGWKRYQDSDIKEAMDLADFAKIHDGIDEPSPDGLLVGKVWIDRGSNPPLLKRWNGSDWDVVNDLEEVNKISAALAEQQKLIDEKINKLATATDLDSVGFHVYKPGYKDQNEVVIDKDSVDIKVGGKVATSVVPKGLVIGNYLAWQPEESGGLAFNLIS